WFGDQWMSIGDIISNAVSAWEGSDINQIDQIKTVLDGLNNNDDVPILPSSYEAVQHLTSYSQNLKGYPQKRDCPPHLNRVKKKLR
ncbi:hypothetical protein, partial [Vibrio parahaemolyticus]|uniref:hypothetical protein n=1 Tax=Vibrio parahaemolyticus TaxID=670 RepID=UPI0021532DB1